MKPLPHFHARPDRERAALEASRAVVALFLRERSSAFSVKELADHAGLSERTFYRYFPRKEDAIRPYVEASLDHVLLRARNAPGDRSLRQVLVDAHADVLDFAVASEGAAFLAIVNATDELRAVWVRIVTDAEMAFGRIVAERLGLPPDGVRARLAGAAVVAAGRLALQSAAAAGTVAPRRIFAECLELLGPALLDARPPEAPEAPC